MRSSLLCIFLGLAEAGCIGWMGNLRISFGPFLYVVARKWALFVANRSGVLRSAIEVMNWRMFPMYESASHLGRTVKVLQFTSYHLYVRVPPSSSVQCCLCFWHSCLVLVEKLHGLIAFAKFGGSFT